MHTKNRKNQNQSNKSQLSQNLNTIKSLHKNENSNFTKIQSDSTVINTIIYYIVFLLLASSFLVFIDKFQFRQQKYFFEIKDDTPFAFLIENIGNEYFSPKFSKIFYILIIDSLIYAFFSNLHCDLDFSIFYILIITLESGFTSYVQSFHSLFLHSFLIFFELYLYCVFLHTRAYKLKWYLLCTLIAFLTTLDFCLRVEAISFAFSFISIIIISIHKTNLLTSPYLIITWKEIALIVFLCISTVFIVLFTFYNTIGLPKFIWLPLSIGDIIDEYKISQWNITLIIIEVISLFFIKYAQLNSYNTFMICILLICLFSVSIIPAYSGETAVITKVFEFKLILVLLTGIILGRQPRLYLTILIALLGILTSWIYRYNFIPLDYQFY